MNVVILTPDGVGSTLLQRALTVQMLLSDFDKPVINLHELTNGIASHYSAELEMMVLNKVHGINFKYSQTLPQIVKLLSEHDHYKTSRLAHYHLLRRNDDVADQNLFYNYLNENFFVILAKRKNLLEFSLSWALNNVHKKLNVYSAEEKISSFLEFYKDPINIDTDTLVDNLEAYKNYISWAKFNFNIGSYYIYENHVHDLEKYILNLPIFAGRNKKMWEESFNISFNDYNKVHRTYSDIGTIALEHQQDLKLLTYEKSEHTDIKSIIVNNMSTNIQNFVEQHKDNYEKAQKSISHMTKLGLMMTGIPIKKHTLAEKRFIVKNFNECVNVYNDWIINNSDLGEPFDNNLIQLSVEKESTSWSIPQ